LLTIRFPYFFELLRPCCLVLLAALDLVRVVLGGSLYDTQKQHVTDTVAMPLPAPWKVNEQKAAVPFDMPSLDHQG
jgi:hypothetical protein